MSVVHFRATWHTTWRPSPPPVPSQEKKISPKTKSLIFQEMELSNSKIKKFLIFSQEKAFLIFSQKNLPTLSSLSPQKFSKKSCSEKISYIFQKTPQPPTPSLPFSGNGSL